MSFFLFRSPRADSRPLGKAPFRPVVAAAMLLAALLAAAFLAPWWRSYLGLTLDGYFPLYGHLILEGKIPYRDFFLHLPPLHALFDAAIQSIFGKSLLTLRILGAAERLLMAAVLVFWLSRHFRAGPALLGSVAAVILASGDDTEILDLYNHHALLAAILAGLALSYGLEQRESQPGRSATAFYLAGFFAALSFGMKQTIGLNATLAVVLVPIVLALSSPIARRELPGRLGRISVGWLPPVLLMAGWLFYHGALSACLRQIFLDAGASKGSPLKLLMRPWLDPLRIPELMLPAVIAIGCLLVLIAGVRLPQDETPTPKRSEWAGLLGAAGLVAVLLLASHLILHPVAERELDLRTVQRIGVLLVAYGVLWPAVVLVWRALRRPLSATEAQILTLGIVSGGTSSALGFSWPAGEALAYPGLALLTVLAVAGTPRFRGAAWLKAPVLAVVVVTVLAAATQKMISPFDFAMWREPSPEDALYESTHPALAGILLGEKTREAVDGTLGIIERASRPGEAIFAFSDMPIFYWLADRPFVSFAALSWFDVTPDRIVDADRQRLFEQLPPVIVFHQIPNHFMVIHEDYFRDGNESALRRMQDQIHELGTNYQVAGFYEPWRQYPPLQVWVRRDRAAEIGLVE